MQTTKYLFFLLASLYAQTAVEASQAVAIISAIKAQPLPLTEQQRLIQEQLKQLAKTLTEAEETRNRKLRTLAHTTANDYFKSSEIAQQALNKLLKKIAQLYHQNPEASIETLTKMLHEQDPQTIDLLVTEERLTITGPIKLGATEKESDKEVENRNIQQKFARQRIDELITKLTREVCTFCAEQTKKLEQENASPLNSGSSSASSSSTTSPTIGSRSITKLFSPVASPQKSGHATPSSPQETYRRKLTASQRAIETRLYDLLQDLPGELTCLIAEYLQPDFKRLSQTLTDHTREVNRLAAISETQFASASSDRTVRIWQKQNEQWACIAILSHRAPVSSIAILARNTADLPSGVRKGELAERIACGTPQGKLYYWDRKASKKQSLEYTSFKFSPHRDAITDIVSLQEDPITFASASEDKTLGLYQKQKDGQLQPQYIECHATPTRLLALAGKLICGFGNGDIMLYNYNSAENTLSFAKQYIRDPERYPISITCLYACPNDFFLACNDGGAISIRSSLDLKHLKSLSLNKNQLRISACIITPEGMLAVAMATTDGHDTDPHDICFIKNPTTSDDPTIISRISTAHNDTVTSLISVGEQLVSSSRDNTINVWD